MIVDDNADMRLLIRDALERRQFEVVEAESGVEALCLLSITVTVPSAIVLDLDMPVMSGRQLCQWLQTEPQFAGIPIVIHTAFPRHFQGEIQGVRHWVTKSAGFLELCNTVEALCSSLGTDRRINGDPHDT